MKRIGSIALLGLLLLSLGCSCQDAERDGSMESTEAPEPTAVVTEQLTEEPKRAEATFSPEPLPQYDGWFVLPEGWTYFSDKAVQYFDGTGRVSVMVSEIGVTAVTYLDRTKEQWQAAYDEGEVDCTIERTERLLLGETEACIVYRTDADGRVCNIYVLWTPEQTYLVTATADAWDALNEVRSMVETFRPF